MDKLIQTYEQQLAILDDKLSKTTNPIEYIRLEAQCIMLNDCVNFAKQLQAQIKQEAYTPTNDGNKGTTA